ncbi:glycosyltransferase [Aquimarina sp. TRL1]|uniref:glycosyltransferase n=1 Tax=Aquimarina sp. (strain TRL1) TaxID=2736252 RepID=UPI00158BA01E|nr:glycosyltransferase [Aquimarina sp. TRL1]QKX04716.1 glycosyltransferase [Aquimarina sp. TRL1]
MQNKKDSKKRILWLHNFPNLPGAGGVWMYNQYEFLKDEVDIYYLDDLRNPLSFLKHMFKLQKLSKEYKIVHAQYGSAVGFLTSLMKTKRILSLKGSDWYKAPSNSTLNKIRISLGSFLSQFSIKRFDHLIVMSHAMKDQVERKYKGIKIDVIVDPIDLNKFRPLEKKNKSKIKKVLFASVNIDNPIKRFELANDSFKYLNKKMPNTELITMSNIPHSQVCDFINGTDVLLLTSTHEGWPNVVKEVLACNIPFVSTKVSDLEKVALRTNNCFACNPIPEELGEALYKSLISKEENLRELVTSYNMDETIIRLKNLYSEYL